MAILLVGSFGLAFDDAEVRKRVLDTAFEYVPLASEDDRDQLQSGLDDALANAGRLGPFTVILLLIGASGMIAALRHAINEAWDLDSRPPILRRKLMDVALVFGATGLLALSLSLTVTRRAERLLQDEGDYGWLLSALLDVVGDALPIVFSALVLLLLYRILPTERPRIAQIWPGALVAALLLALVREGLELYLERMSDFGALYGSLGALMALLIFVYASSLVVVFGAEYASEWDRPDDDS